MMVETAFLFFIKIQKKFGFSFLKFLLFRFCKNPKNKEREKQVKS